MSEVDSTWFLKFVHPVAPDLRLFCLPFAGGGASNFRDWATRLDYGIDLRAIQLPGRENRVLEEPCRSMNEIVEPLLEQMEPLLDKPYVVFGHSMGAKIGYELIHGIVQRGWTPPLRFCASGAPAPHLPSRRPPISQLPLSEFLQELREYAGTPTQVLDNAELQELFLPMLRADFKIVEQYQSAADRLPLTVATSLFGARDDTYVELEDLLAWQDIINVVNTSLFSGGHFFIREQFQAVLDEVVAVRNKANGTSSAATCN
jgi:medium-chain acyl-[acyl-carrier-protein] hydrolase